MTTDTADETTTTPARPPRGAPPEPTGGAWWRLGLTAGGLVALGALWSFAAVAVIGGVVALVALHEAGHLLAARLSGVVATEYAIGLGPVIYSRRAGGMAWSLRAVPLGAFVRVVGMSAADEVPAELEAATYRRATLPRRLAIALAGPGANILAAAVLLVASLTMWGEPNPQRWHIAAVAEGSPAEVAGIEPGERVVAVDRTPTATLSEVVAALAPLGGRQATLRVLDPSGTAREVTVDVAERVSLWGTVGEDLDLDIRGGAVTVAGVLPGGVADRAGLRTGDQVVAVAGRPVTSAVELTEAVEGIDGGVVPVTVSRGGSTTTAEVSMGVDVAASPARGVIGIVQETPAVPLPLPKAVPAAASQLAEAGAASAKGIARILWPPNLVSFVSSAVHTAPPTAAEPAAASDPTSDPNRILSIVGAVSFGTTIAEVDAGALLFFLALMSLFVGLFNLVPLPPFDGGHVAVALYEALRERLSPTAARYMTSSRALNRIAHVVVAVLLVLGAAAIWLDITNPVA